MKLPELRGSEKQIAWAENIRKKIASQFDLEDISNKRMELEKVQIRLDELEELFDTTKEKKYEDELDDLETIEFKLKCIIKENSPVEKCLLTETSAKFYIEHRGMESIKKSYNE